MENSITSAFKTCLIGFGLAISSKLLIGDYRDVGWGGIKEKLSTQTLTFPDDYISFIILGGIIWPWLKTKLSMPNKYLYLVGSITLLYIFTPDYKYKLPSTYKIKRRWNKFSTVMKTKSTPTCETEQNVNEFIDEWKDMESSAIIFNLMTYVGLFYYLFIKNVSNFIKNDNLKTKIYPLIFD